MKSLYTLVVNFDFSIGRFGESDEAMYAERFLKSFEDGDDELLDKTKTAPMITHMDTEVFISTTTLILFL